ncbi:ChaN family lipoprotein [Pseudomonas sp. LRF_L74]|uniref:ChaN family lipoprotein n=1 Tax=Pseudomonas sp. LRF_L74 TaxID=3369422 RepID=UPI003F5F4CB5
MRRLLLCTLILLSACQHTTVSPPPAWQSPDRRDHAELGVIRELSSGRVLTPAELVERLAVAPRVVVGEQHDNPDHHALELWLLRELERQRGQGSLLLEMLSDDQQSRVAAVQAGGGALADPFEALAWKRGWAWSLYGPLVMHALRQPYPLLAADLSRQEVMAIYRSQPKLAGTASNATQVRARLLDDIRTSHCNLLPENQLPAMLAVQLQRDRRMAQRLLEAPTPALLVAGAFHARKDLGLPLHLQDVGAQSAASVLLLAEVGSTVASDEADYVWFTAAQPAEDHCAELRH